MSRSRGPSPGSPQVILADEPTANLDTTVGVQILDLFRDLAKGEGTGLVIVTHDPKVRQVSDRVVGIRDGSVWRLRHIGIRPIQDAGFRYF